MNNTCISLRPYILIVCVNSFMNMHALFVCLIVYFLIIVQSIISPLTARAASYPIYLVPSIFICSNLVFLSKIGEYCLHHVYCYVSYPAMHTTLHLYYIFLQNCGNLSYLYVDMSDHYVDV